MPVEPEDTEVLAVVTPEFVLSTVQLFPSPDASQMTSPSPGLKEPLVTVAETALLPPGLFAAPQIAM